MRTASLVLGIIGGVFGIIAGFLAMLFGGVGLAVEGEGAGTVVGLGFAAVFIGVVADLADGDQVQSMVELAVAGS